MDEINLKQERPRVVDIVARIVERDNIAREELLAKVDRLQENVYEDNKAKSFKQKFQEIDWKVFWVRYAAAYPSTVMLAPIAAALYGFMLYQLIAGLWR